MSMNYGAGQGPLGYGGAYDYGDNPDPGDELLTAKGYRKVSGSGADAIWEIPAETIKGVDYPAEQSTAQAILRKELGADSPYSNANQKAAVAPKAPDRITQGGVVYERGADGGWKPAVGLPAATTNAGGRTSNPDLGAEQAFTASENQKTRDAAQAARDQAAQQALVQLTEDTRRWGVEFAQKQVDRDYLVKKDAWAQQNGDKRLALDTQAQLASITAQQDTLKFNIQQAQQHAAELQQQREMDVAQFNSTGQFNVDRANADATDRRDARIQQTNADIGQLGQDTGNRGKFAAFATANQGFGQAGTAIGQGTSLIDNASAQPLENSLQTRNGLMAQSATPYTFNPLSLSPLTNTAAGPLSAAAPYGTNPNLAAQQAQAQQMANQNNAASAGTSATPAEFARMAALAAQSQGVNTISSGLPAMEQGGMVRGAYMSGDSGDGKENPEINIPLGTGGETIVISMKGMKPEAIRKAKSKLQKFATGGLFDQLGDSPLSKQFLGDASKKFRQGTPWENQPGALPSPVYGSSPGFSPLLNSLLASGRALEQGIPVSYSNWLTDRYRPNTINGPRTVSRTA